MSYIENEENNAIVNTEPHDSEVAPSLVAEGGKQYGEELSANPKGFGYTKQFFVSELPVTGIPDAIYLIQQSDGKYNGFVWNIAYQRFDKVYSGAIPQFKGADGERATPVREVVAPKEAFEKIFKGKVAFEGDVYYKGQLLGQDEKGGEGLKIYDIPATTYLAQLVANYPMPCIANTYGMYVIIDIKHTEKYTGEIESLSGRSRYVINTDQNVQLGTIFSDPKYRKDYLVEGDTSFGTVEIEYGEFVNNQVSLTIPAIQQNTLATNEVGYIKLVAAHTTPAKTINLFRVGIPSYSGGTNTSYKLVFSGIVDEDGTDPILYTAIFTKVGSTYTATLYRTKLATEKPVNVTINDTTISLEQFIANCEAGVYTVLGTIATISNCINGNPYRIRLIGVNHDVLADTDLGELEPNGTKAKTTWQFVDIPFQKVNLGLQFDTDRANGGGENMYGDTLEINPMCPSNMHGYDTAVGLRHAEQVIYDSLPTTLQKAIKTVRKDIYISDISDDISEYTSTATAILGEHDRYGSCVNTKLFSLSATEIGIIPNPSDEGKNPFPYSVIINEGEEDEQEIMLEGKKYPYFNETYAYVAETKGEETRLCYYNNNMYYYWLRSPCLLDSHIWGRVNGGGGVDHDYTSNDVGVAPAFCI